MKLKKFSIIISVHINALVNEFYGLLNYDIKLFQN